MSERNHTRAADQPQYVDAPLTMPLETDREDRPRSPPHTHTHNAHIWSSGKYHCRLKLHLVITKVTLGTLAQDPAHIPPHVRGPPLPNNPMPAFHLKVFFCFFLTTQTPDQVFYPNLKMKNALGCRSPSVRGQPRSSAAIEFIRVHVAPETQRRPGLGCDSAGRGRVCVLPASFGEN